jgi:hypothetical protein
LSLRLPSCKADARNQAITASVAAFSGAGATHLLVRFVTLALGPSPR